MQFLLPALWTKPCLIPPTTWWRKEKKPNQFPKIDLQDDDTFAGVRTQISWYTLSEKRVYIYFYPIEPTSPRDSTEVAMSEGLFGGNSFGRVVHEYSL